MTAPTPDPTAPPTTGDPAAPPVNTPPATGETRSLAELLAGLDDAAKAVVMGEVSKARDEAHGLRTRLRTSEADAASWQADQAARQTDQQKAEAARDAAIAERDAARTLAVSTTVARLAADKFADVRDATAAVKPADYLKADGTIDEAKLTADLDAVLTDRPHWAKTVTPPVPPKPAPNPLQGSQSQTLAERAAGGDKKAERALKAQQLLDLARGSNVSGA